MNIAVLIPAFNEEKTVGDVIRDYHRYFPEAGIFVIDNRSTDKTRMLAETTLKKFRIRGRVLIENRPGKAFALRKAFREVDADYYVVTDADLTYPASDGRKLLAAVVSGEADMAVGDRISGGRYRKENKRMFHGAGNNFVRSLINTLFRSRLKDIMSGYRVFSREFIRNFPVLSKGFEIETEMTLHALDKRFAIREIPVSYRDRPKGSHSKLNTFRDGFRVIMTIFNIFKNYRPLLFFASLSILFFLVALAIGFPVILEYVRVRYIYKVPSAILSTGLMVFSMLLLSVGLILDTVVNNHRFDYELHLLERKH